MKTRFENMTTNMELNALINKANELLHTDSAMMETLRLKNDFKYDSGDGAKVFCKIANCDKVAPIFFYKPKWRFSRAMGYSDGKAIHLNSYKFNSFSDSDIIGLLCHEWLHFLFSHGGNYPSAHKNNFSVNYFVSSSIKEWL
jgi:hypothetical protein